MTAYQQHVKECIYYGIPPLTYCDYILAEEHGVNESDMYSLASDLYCGAFINIWDAIGYYMESEQ